MKVGVFGSAPSLFTVWYATFTNYRPHLIWSFAFQWAANLCSSMPESQTLFIVLPETSRDLSSACFKTPRPVARCQLPRSGRHTWGLIILLSGQLKLSRVFFFQRTCLVESLQKVKSFSLNFDCCENCRYFHQILFGTFCQPLLHYTSLIMSWAVSALE